MEAASFPDSEKQQRVEVLVVEDSATQAEQLKYLLEQAGFKAFVAHDGAEALRLLAHHKPGIVLTDVVMPGMDGYELCRRIKAEESLRDLPVILVTSLSDPRDVVMGLECGADNFIVKPYDEEELLTRMQFILLNRRLAGAETADIGVEVFFGGQRHFITSGRLQILNLLLTTYDTAVRRNQELELVRDELKEVNEALEEKVRERTADLMAEIAMRRRAEEALAASERRYRQLYQRSLAGLFRSTAEGEILECNEAFARITGYADREEVLAIDASDLYHDPEDRRKIVRRVTRERQISGLEVRLRRRDGSEVWVLEDLTLAVDEATGRQVLEGNLTDITDRKHAQELAQQNEERFQALVQNSTDVIGVLQADGTFSFIGPNARSMLGYEPEKMIGTGYLDLVHPDDVPSTASALRHLLATPGGSVTVECRLRDAEGKWHVIETTAANLLDNPAVGGVVLNARDISERRQMEDQLRQAQKMEAVGRLAGGVAHDFNNVLQALLSQVQLLRMRSGQEPREAAIAELEQQVRRGAALTRQLLLFSRRETTRPERLDLNQVVAHAGEFLRRLIRENIELTLDLAPSALPVMADEAQLEQVLMNLVVNASDAMPEGGTLALATGAADGSRVWLTVSDTGCGIPDALRERIFEPFFTTKDPGKGTGLGLPVVHGIVAVHGGTITVESRVGTGTTFRVELPRIATGEDLADRETAGGPSLLPAGRGEGVLVVEDESAAREGLEQILGTLGYRVVAVGSGEEALLLPAEVPCQLLLTDLVLPGISGLEMARKLQQRWPELKVILMSGYTEDEVTRQGIATREVHFLEKPFDMATLARTLRTVLTGA